MTLTAPQAGATLTGAVQLQATGEHCDRVEFYVDDVSVGQDESSPYGVTWNSGLAANGAHTVKVRGEGGGGSAEDQVSITVQNEAGTVVVTVAPADTTVALRETVQFSSVVTGSANPAVTWSVDDSPARGTITSAGLYTAPGALPSPATATVRATSVADPTKSAAATITVTGGSVPTTVTSLCQQAFGGAYEAAELGEDAVDLAAEAVWGASELNGGETLTGTLTQAAQGSEVWTYSSQPTNKLLLVYFGGPTIEFTFTTFDGWKEGTWEDFTDSHLVNFRVVMAGQFDVVVQSQVTPVGGAEVPYTWKSQWTRQVTGTAVYLGENLSVDVLDTGVQQGYNEPGFVGLETETSTSGTISSPSIQTSVNDTYWATYHHSSSTGHVTRNWLKRVNSTATLGGDSYAYHDAGARWEAQSLLNDPGAFNVVRDPSYWVVSGTMTKNGGAFGEVAFDGPVLIDTNGPSLVLKLAGNEEVMLHTLVPDPGE